MFANKLNFLDFLLPGEHIIEEFNEVVLKNQLLTIYWTNIRLCWIFAVTAEMGFINHNQIKAQFTSKAQSRAIVGSKVSQRSLHKINLVPVLKIDYLKTNFSPVTSLGFFFEYYETRDKLSKLITPIIEKKNVAEKDTTSLKSLKDLDYKPEVSNLNIDKQFREISPNEIGMRKELLSKNAELADLHKDLVISGFIPEEEFWRNYISQLDSQLIKLKQLKAQYFKWININIKTIENQEHEYTLTPEIIHSIFLQHPIVKKAYDKNVPRYLNKESFWKRYFGSRYFHQNSNTSQDIQPGTDKLFDKLLEREKAENQPIVPNFSHEMICRLINLEATSYDRSSIENCQNFVKISDLNSKPLSIIRKLNRTSNSRLKNAKRKRDEKEEFTIKKHYMEAVFIDDLTVEEPVFEDIPLIIKNNYQYSKNYQPSGNEIRIRNEITNKFLNSNSKDFSSPINKSWDPKANSKTFDSLSKFIKNKDSKALKYIKASQLPKALSHTSEEFKDISELIENFWSIYNSPPMPVRSHKLESIINEIKSKDIPLRKKVENMIGTNRSNKALIKYPAPIFNSVTKALKAYSIYKINNP
ncbi:hypothetical protein CONCODRAFT_170005 [Conidiobolus coronatus NRRL 28638]|uniref:BSD domain-containing protein n=1 Tax=Conidiobolus coronatus (strain ATCC 28846 / CBS 209.66 / NRRL 28638) TaxID=796925 RepID=A0A137P8J6_CONC2|nr:hypothetical protein CONCODRAFT_170005 [Conidiobolus coronatus NRRL 28638]|eukprot:KXN71302.1 hypothetical protein CONCODRAFT_170005 [Conidiobolus coronatus NRRL 28638]